MELSHSKGRFFTSLKKSEFNSFISLDVHSCRSHPFGLKAGLSLSHPNVSMHTHKHVQKTAARYFFCPGTQAVLIKYRACACNHVYLECLVLPRPNKPTIGLQGKKETVGLY